MDLYGVIFNVFEIIQIGLCIFFVTIYQLLVAKPLMWLTPHSQCKFFLKMMKYKLRTNKCKKIQTDVKYPMVGLLSSAG